MKNLTIALDLEGTLIQDHREPRPRPGLHRFLDELHDLGARIVMMTTVEEAIFRVVAKGLVNLGAAPAWLEDVEYVSWERPCKDLSFIVGADPQSCWLVDDYEGYVCVHQKDRWIQIETFFAQGEEDRELERVALEILQKVSGHGLNQ